MFLHYLDFILMALDLIRGLMKLMQLFNEDWIRPCNWVRLCNGWRASKTIPLPLGEHLLRRLVRNKLPLHHKWKMTYGHPPCPKACAPWFKARQNLRPNCEKQNVKEAKKKKNNQPNTHQTSLPAKAIRVFCLSNESHLKVLRKHPISWLHKCEVQTHLLWN